LKNKILQEILDFAQEKLTSEYEFVGVAIGDNNATLNTSDEKSKEIKINITVEE